jgi:hypothetical protein
VPSFGVIGGARAARRGEALALLLLASTPAWADAPAGSNQAHNYVLVGPLGQITHRSGEGNEWAVGMEVSYLHKFFDIADAETSKRLSVDFSGLSGPGLGAYAQLEGVQFNRLRGSAGVEATWFVGGLELGPSLQGHSGTYGSSLGVQIAPFVSFGFVSFGFRIDLPIARLSPGKDLPVGFGGVLALKTPVFFDGDLFDFHVRSYDDKDLESKTHPRPDASDATER